jgi:hypothetical protein
VTQARHQTPQSPRSRIPDLRSRAHLADRRVHDRGAVHLELDAAAPHLNDGGRHVGREGADLGVGCAKFWRVKRLRVNFRRLTLVSRERTPPRSSIQCPPHQRKHLPHTRPTTRTLGLGISPLGPSIFPALTSARIMSGCATARLKAMDLPLDSMSASMSSSPGGGGG